MLSSFWTTDTFTGDVVKSWTTENFHSLLTTDVYRTVALRSIGVAAAVTVICVVVALPMAFFMAKVASPRVQRWLVVAVLTPLWASYLVKAYAWRGMFSSDGVAQLDALADRAARTRLRPDSRRSSCWPTCGCRS